MAVNTLELPTIFGIMLRCGQLWTMLVRYAASRIPLFCPRGCITCVSIYQFARVIGRVVEKGGGGVDYPIDGENLTWVVDYAHYQACRTRETSHHSAGWTGRSWRDAAKKPASPARVRKPAQSRAVHTTAERGDFHSCCCFTIRLGVCT